MFIKREFAVGLEFKNQSSIHVQPAIQLVFQDVG